MLRKDFYNRLRLLFVSVGLFMTTPVTGADAAGYLVLTSDYVFRGVSYSDSHPAFQAGGDLSFDSGVFLGVWGSTVDISSGGGGQRDLQIDYYLGYQFDVSTDWNLGANIVSYTFPRAEGMFDYNYVEYSLVANFDDHAWLEYSYSPDLYNTGYETHNLDLYTEWPMPAKLLLGAGIGYYDVSQLSGSGYAYWQLGVTRPFSRIDVDLRYHDTNKDVFIISTPERAERRLVLSARLSF